MISLLREAPEVLIILIPVLLFALVFHEYAHAYVAYRLGDPTAKNMGRLTFNPLVHLDPFGAIMIMLIGFGYAKPVPVDSRYLQDPRRDLMKIAAAGPLANLILAFLSGLVIRVLASSFPELLGMNSLTRVLVLSTQVNIALAVFNLIPIPPLDGSQILSMYMIKTNPELVYKLQRYGPQVLFGIIALGLFTGISILGMFMMPFIRFFFALFTGAG